MSGRSPSFEPGGAEAAAPNTASSSSVKKVGRGKDSSDSSDMVAVLIDRYVNFQHLAIERGLEASIAILYCRLVDILIDHEYIPMHISSDPHILDNLQRSQSSKNMSNTIYSQKLSTWKIPSFEFIF
jgi:hypothetical protein